jgi:RNA polymerase sigma-70 factor, ECF subfamily
LRLSGLFRAFSAVVSHNAAIMDTTANEPKRTDAELVGRCLRGDLEAFHDLTTRYYRPMGGFVLKRVGRPDVVEDLVQETFLEAFRSLKAGKRPEHFSSWLFGIAHNTCGKWLRRKRPVLFDPREPPVDLAAPPELSAQEELEEQRNLLAKLESGLAGLPAETRQMLDLKHKEGKTCEQIAGQLGRPVGTVKSLLARTYKMLRARMGRGGDEGP